MACGIEKALCFLKIVITKLTVAPISFIFFEISKFVLVLALAFWITIGIFLMWESIIPEAARRLSAAAEAVVANTSGLTPQNESKVNINESGSYPFVVDLPKTASSAAETHINDESSRKAAEPEPEAFSKKRPSNPVQERSSDTPPLEAPTEDIAIDAEEYPLTPNNSETDVDNQETPIAMPEKSANKPAETTE